MERRRHRAKGMTALEVALVGVLTFMFCFFALDVWIFVWGYTLNDSASRDAARAAASAGDRKSAERHVLGSLYRHKGFGAVGNPSCDWQGHPQDFLYEPNPSDGIPFVRVTTRCILKPPFPIYIFGKGWIAGPTELARTYTFPLLAVPFKPRPVGTGNSTGDGEPGDDDNDPLFPG